MILTTDQRWKRVSEGYGKGKMESTQLLHTRTVGLVHENTAAEVVTSVCSQRWCGLQSYLVFTTFANFNPAKHFFFFMFPGGCSKTVIHAEQVVCCCEGCPFPGGTRQQSCWCNLLPLIIIQNTQTLTGLPQKINRTCHYQMQARVFGQGFANQPRFMDASGSHS